MEYSQRLFKTSESVVLDPGQGLGVTHTPEPIFQSLYPGPISQATDGSQRAHSTRNTQFNQPPSNFTLLVRRSVGSGPIGFGWRGQTVKTLGHST